MGSCRSFHLLRGSYVIVISACPAHAGREAAVKTAHSSRLALPLFQKRAVCIFDHCGQATAVFDRVLEQSAPSKNGPDPTLEGDRLEPAYASLSSRTENSAGFRSGWDAASPS